MTRLQIQLARSAARRRTARLDQDLGALTSGVKGDVIELGCGTGTLFPYFPDTVRHLLAVEPADDLRALADAAADRLPGSIEVVGGLPDGTIPAASNSADFIVCRSVFCSVRDPQAFVGEIRRVLRPDGELRIFEHVVAPGRMLRVSQRIADALFWPRLMAGCHTTRDTVRTIEQGGFCWRSLERRTYVRNPLMFMVGPHVLGVATPD